MLVLRQVLTCIFQVSRWWEAGALTSDEAISSDLIQNFFIMCIVCLCMWLFSKQRDSYIITSTVSVEMLTTKIKNQLRDFELNQAIKMFAKVMTKNLC